MSEERKYEKRQMLLDGLQVAEGLLEGLIDEITVDRVGVWESALTGKPQLMFHLDNYKMAQAFARKFNESLEPKYTEREVRWDLDITDGRRRYEVSIWSVPPPKSRVEHLRAELAKAEAEAAA